MNGGRALVAAGALLAGCSLAGSAIAEENRYNIHLELGPDIVVTQPNKTLTANDVQTAGFHLRASFELQPHERIGAELGWGMDVLFAETGGATYPQQQLFGGVRVRPWFSTTPGFVLPWGKRHVGFINDLLSDAWIDAHVGASFGVTRFLWDVGIGARVPLVKPLQTGLFARYTMELSPDDKGAPFSLVTVGVTGSVGFADVHPPPDTDDDGVPDAEDHCPDTPRHTRVNAQGCEVKPDESGPRPSCSDSDLDGVCDGEDECADTPVGVRVDKRGCPADREQEAPPANDDNKGDAQ